MLFPRRPPPSVELLEDRCLPSGSAAAPLRPATPATSYRVSAAYGQLPLRFEANPGQADGGFDFVSRGSGYALFFGPGGAVLSLQKPTTPSRGLFRTTAAADPTVIRMGLVGGNPSARPAGLDPLSGVSNYYVGNNPALWRRGVTGYGRVEYQDVYPGVNVVYYGNQSRLEYDFVVSPGADPGVIRLSFQGAEGLSLDGAGDVVLHTAAGDVIEQAPVVYQEANGTRQPVSGSYLLLGGGQVGFAVGAYDHARPLVIDPVLSYSTYLGGVAVDQGFGIAVDDAGDAFVTGETSSPGFPLQNPAQGTLADAKPNRGDVFVAKFDPSGTRLLYSTFLGGTAEDGGFGVAVDPQGNAYVTGFTSSVDFPTKNGLPIVAGEGDGSAFVAKFDASGALVYSTYLGGRHDSTGHAIAVDRLGDAYVTGLTDTPDFPTKNAFQAFPRGVANAFVTKLAPGGNQIVYSTFLGGDNSFAPAPNVADEAGDGIAVDAAGDAYVMGNTDSDNFPTTAGAFQRTYGGGEFDNFVTKFDPSGSRLLYSTYLGGNDDDQGFAIAIDSAGAAYVTGSTASANFPTTPGAFQRTFGGGRPDKATPDSIDVGDIFVTKLNPAGSGLAYSTFLGGSDNEEGTSIAVDAAGNAFIAGHTFSTDFPTQSAVQDAISGVGNGAGIVAGLNPGGSALLFSTYLGGGLFDKANGIAVDHSGDVFVTGQTESTTFPTANAFQSTQKTTETHGTNAFVTKLTQTEISLSVTTSVSPNPVRVGQNLTFTVTVTNLGPAPATGVVLTEVLQGSFRFVSLRATQGTVTAAGNTVTANLGSLGVGASATVTIVVTPLGAGTIQARGKVAAEEENIGATPALVAVQVLGRIHFSPWLADVLLFPNGRNLPHHQR